MIKRLLPIVVGTVLALLAITVAQTLTTTPTVYIEVPVLVTSN